jgi:hypothetical protein
MTGEKNLPWINQASHEHGADTKQLRSFGFMVGGILAIIGLWPLIHGQNPRLWAFVVAGLLVIPAAVWPRSLDRVYRIWMILGRVLGEINSRIILTLIFFGVVLPIGVAKRWLGDDPLLRKLDRHAATYRKTREARPPSHMRRQF